MRSRFLNNNLFGRLWILGALACVSVSVQGLFAAQQPAVQKSAAQQAAPKATASAANANAAGAKLFDTPQQATDALVDAAQRFDLTALAQIFGPDGNEVIFSGEFPQDRQNIAD